MLEIGVIVVGPLQVNCFLLVDAESRQAAVVDPGAEAERILKAVADTGAELKYILLTHGHFDHLCAVSGIKKATGAEILIHAADAPQLEDAFLSGAQLMGVPFEPSKADRHLAEGETIQLGASPIQVLETPGHTPGGVSFLLEAEGRIITGDCLFCDGLGRTDLPGGDFPTIVKSIQRLTQLDGALEILPGHGPSSTIAHEREHNPVFSQQDLGF